MFEHTINAKVWGHNIHRRRRAIAILRSVVCGALALDRRLGLLVVVVELAVIQLEGEALAWIVVRPGQRGEQRGRSVWYPLFCTRC
jgi:hypothetical protein